MKARFALAAAVLLVAAPAAATVAQGVAKWRAGDWAGAVAEWMTPAARGDADALFNLGQAYKLGRGVPQNTDTAQDYYRKAAAKGHLAAQANLGISLYQSGNRTEAVGWLRQAADRGDARAQYVLGVATFNGEGVARNPALGYGYMLRAREGGLAPAGPAAARMAALLPPTDRARGEAAAAALASGQPVPVEIAMPASRLIPNPTRPAAAPTQTAQAPAPAVGQAPSAPSQLTPTPAATAQAMPAQAAATPTRSAQAVPAPPVRTAQSAPVATPVVPPTATRAPEVATASTRPAAPVPVQPSSASLAETVKAVLSGDKANAKPASAGAAEPSGFRVQLGAYAAESAARSAWATLVAQSAEMVRGLKPIFAPASGLVRLQIGPFAERQAARDLCAKLSAAGRPCFVVAS